MTGLMWRTLARSPRRLLVGVLGIAVPVALLAATAFFVDTSSRSMTRRALANVRIELQAVASSPLVDTAAQRAQLAHVAGVTRVEPFAAADLMVSFAGSPPVKARLFAVEPSYLANHPWVRPTSGSLALGALLSDPLRATLPGSPASVTISLPGDGVAPAELGVGGTVDLRAADPWFSVTSGDAQGDVFFSPNAVVIDYATFERAILPALRADAKASSSAGATTGTPSAPSTGLAPNSLETHVAVDQRIFNSDPSLAVTRSLALKRTMERTVADLSVVDNGSEALTRAKADAVNAKVLFLLLGIPGVLVAGALTLSTASALVAAQRREQALLRLRGATTRQLVRLATVTALAVGLVGSAAGLALGALGVDVLLGSQVWQGVGRGQLAVSAGLAVVAGLMVTGLRLLPVTKAARRSSVVDERQVLDRGWAPAWRRRRLDLVAVAVGLAILGINVLTGGFRQAPTEGQTLALSFYVLLAPLALWLGAGLLAMRGVAALFARATRPQRARPLGTWTGAALRWMGRRPARAGATMVLGVLAVAYGTNVLAFVHTYDVAKRTEVGVAVGSDIRVTPAQVTPAPVPPLSAPDVAASTPIRIVSGLLGTDRRAALAIEPASYGQAVRYAPLVIDGRGLDGIGGDPLGVLVVQDVAKSSGVVPGDPLTVVFTDGAGRPHPVTLHTLGVYRAVAPSVPQTELVVNVRALEAAGIAPLPSPDLYLARAGPGHPVAAVAARLDAAAAPSAVWKVTTFSDALATEQSTLATLDLRGLGRIDTTGTALIAALGIAVLGAFVVLERRREMAVLRAIGATTSQVLTSPAIEGAATVAVSVALGVPLGLCMTTITTRVLGLVFTLPPPLLRVQASEVAVLVALVAGASAISLGAALAAVARLRPAAVLREA